VRSAAISRSASPGGKILGRVGSTRTSGTVRDRTDPPARRVSSPRGTGVDLHRALPRVRICGPAAPGREDHRSQDGSRSVP